jgi:hypothetical protein
MIVECKHFMCLILVAAELVICGFVMYYWWIEDTTCDAVSYALGAFVIAQFGHIIIVVQSLFARSKKNRCKFVTLGIWFLIHSAFVALAVLLTTSETCETTQDFNIAFAIVLAELLTSFIFSCCSFCSVNSSCCPLLTRQYEKVIVPSPPPIDPTDVIVGIDEASPLSSNRLNGPIDCDSLRTRKTTISSP